MISCNFPVLDEPVRFAENLPNMLIVEEVHVYSQILYSLYQQENGIQPDYPFHFFDDNFENLSSLAVIQNPLTFDFNTAAFKKLLFSRIIATLDMDERQKIESTYNELVQYFNQQVFEDIEIEVSISEAYKLEELFKLLKINILDNSSSIFDKTQLILNVFHELSNKELFVFCGLGTMLTAEEFNLIIETATLNQQNVLFLENHEVEKLVKIKQFCVDKDYFCTEKML
ncbi:type II-A CRISPR-associated protein Csn2 [Lactovum odontotermitis]